jgi:hypothetical protein
VRAWLIQGDSKAPLPVERAEDSFEVVFADLDDGLYELKLSVMGPAFTQAAKVPFVVRNPLRVDVTQSDEGASVWMSFNPGEIDYRTLRASVKIRKPPELGVVVPAEKMPDGRWRVPLNETEGILELAFSIAGNYMNKEGFYVRSQPVLVSLPLAPDSVETFRFDALGNTRARPDSAAKAQEATAQFDPGTGALTGETGEHAAGADEEGRRQTPQERAPEQQDAAKEHAQVAPTGAANETAVNETKKDAPTGLPLWFVGVISMVNLLVLVVIWWFLRPRPLQLPEGADSGSLDSSTSENEDDTIIKAFKVLPA